MSHDFNNYWNFPHALGAIDRKHIVIQAPPRAGSEFFNCKKTYSFVLMGVCNGHYQFTMVDIGDTGRQSDGSGYNNSNLGHAIDNILLNIPSAEKLTNESERRSP